MTSTRRRQPASPTAAQHVSEALRRGGFSVTAQRLAVYEVVSENQHSTAADIVEQVGGRIGSVSRQAVYDALEVLERCGLVRRIEPAGSPALYETRVGDNHHHAICRVCGTTVDVDCAVGRKPCLEPSETNGFVIEEAEVVFWGLCRKCARGRTPEADGRRRIAASTTSRPETRGSPSDRESREQRTR